LELPRRVAELVPAVGVADRSLELVRVGHGLLELGDDRGQARLDFAELGIRDVDVTHAKCPFQSSLCVGFEDGGAACRTSDPAIGVVDQPPASWSSRSWMA